MSTASISESFQQKKRKEKKSGEHVEALRSEAGFDHVFRSAQLLINPNASHSNPVYD